MLIIEKKYILVLGKGPTQELDYTALTAKKEFPINFTEQHKKFRLSFHYNGINSYIFVSSVEIYKFKVKDSEINAALFCLANVSKDFSFDNMKKTGLYWYVYDFSVDYNSIDVVDSLNIHMYLMKKHDRK